MSGRARRGETTDQKTKTRKREKKRAGAPEPWRVSRRAGQTNRRSAHRRGTRGENPTYLPGCARTDTCRALPVCRSDPSPRASRAIPPRPPRYSRVSGHSAQALRRKPSRQMRRMGADLGRRLRRSTDLRLETPPRLRRCHRPRRARALSTPREGFSAARPDQTSSNKGIWFVSDFEGTRARSRPTSAPFIRSAVTIFFYFFFELRLSRN